MTVTFEVDPIQLFDTIKQHGTQAIGDRVIGVLLTGEAGFAESVGMSFYGIVVKEASK